jgi:hypothetical protein
MRCHTLQAAGISDFLACNTFAGKVYYLFYGQGCGVDAGADPSGCPADTRTEPMTRPWLKPSAGF